MLDETGGVPLRFALVQRGGAAHEVTLHGTEVAFLGRAPKSAVVVNESSVSSAHVEFSAGRIGNGKSQGKAGQICVLARDRSQNGTGLCKLGPDGFPDLANILRLGGPPEVLEDGHVLVVPLRSKCRNVRQNEVLETSLFHFYSYRVGIVWPPSSIRLRAQGGGAGGVVLPARVPDKLGDDDILPDCYDSASGAGRWNYQARLGEGGLGVVYRAYDCSGSLGHVAVKVLKHPQRAYWGKQHCFSMHRESQWSLQKLHNTKDGRYCESAAKLFARYLEDYTGLLQVFPGDFDARRKKFETPGMDWEKEGPIVSVASPYVVMELVEGEPLHVAMDREWRTPSNHATKDPPPMSVHEKRQVLLQAARALEYLATFGLIHRDFRGCNMHLAERATESSPCKLKVLDLGVMITDEDWQQSNTNDAVQAFRKRGETEEKRRRYDWLPWEVRNAADGIGPPLNFEKPVHSFDMFSLGVLALHLTIGRTEARQRLSEMEHAGAGKDLKAVEAMVIDTSMLGLDPHVHCRMLGPAASRPTPSDVVKSIEAQLLQPQKLPSVMRPHSGALAPAMQRPPGQLCPEVTLSRTKSDSWQAPAVEEPTREPPAPPPLVAPLPPAGPPQQLWPPLEPNGTHLHPKDLGLDHAGTASNGYFPHGADDPDPLREPRVADPLRASAPGAAALPPGPLQGVAVKSIARERCREDHRSSSYEYSESYDEKDAPPLRRAQPYPVARSRSQDSPMRNPDSFRVDEVWQRWSRRSRSPKVRRSPRRLVSASSRDREPGAALLRALRQCRGNFATWNGQVKLPEGRSCHWILRFPLEETSNRGEAERGRGRRHGEG